MSITPSRASWVFSFACLLCACNRGLPAGEEKLDLSSAGLNASIQAPIGGKAAKSGVSGVEVLWGEHGEGARLELSPGATTLACTPREEECKVLESDATSAVLTYKLMGKSMIRVAASVVVGGAKYGCSGIAHSPEDARRLVATCKSVTSTGAVSAAPGASASPTAALPTAAPAAAAPPVLEELKIEDQAKGLRCSLRIPKGWTDKPLTGGGHQFAEPSAKPRAVATVITLTPYFPVKSVDAAAKEFKSSDVGGLDTIADQRALGPKTFLVATAPRGTGNIMSVNVYASGKKSAMLVKCWGSAADKPLLEEICSSLHVD